MSHEINTVITDNLIDLGEIVAYHRDYWTGTLWDYELEREYNGALKSLDTTKIDKLLKESSAEMFEREYGKDEPTVAKDTGFNLDRIPF